MAARGYSGLSPEMRVTPRRTAGFGHENGEEHAEQRHLGADDAPEDVRAAEAVVPQLVDVEAGDGPAEHDEQ